MIYDVAIIGAGPAGLFAAYELSKNCSLNILVIEKGMDISKRRCPSFQSSVRCKQCDPCNILCGLGGAGGLSDGKLNLHHKIGGDLEEFVTRTEAEDLITQVEQVFLAHGVTGEIYGRNTMDLQKQASAAGVTFLPILQRHIGSDRLQVIIASLRDTLLKQQVHFLLQSTVQEISSDTCFHLHLDNGTVIDASVVLAAPGRSGSDWLSGQAKKLGIHTRFAPIDIGVRVEVPASVMKPVTDQVWDPKFHITTDTYHDFVRTFCTCPRGFVVMEDYGEFVCVNGHSMASTYSENTNFAFLSTVRLTEPVENTTLYGKSIAIMATTIGGKMPIIQRLKDLRQGRRSTSERLQQTPVKQTLHRATPGDIAMALPHRIVTNMLEGLEKLDQVIPGVASDTTLLYAPEVKFYSMRFLVNNYLETNLGNFFVAGDGAGLSRGIVASAATGIIAARGILQKQT